MPIDRITSLHVAGMRAIEDVTLPLSGLTVLIGENGTGKTTILEALELLRQAAKPLAFAPDILDRAHGPFRDLLRRGAPELVLQTTIEGEGRGLHYMFAAALVGTVPHIIEERLWEEAPEGEPRTVLSRRGKVCKYLGPSGALQELSPIGEQSLSMVLLGAAAPQAVTRALTALGRIEHQVPFETRPLWQQQDLGIRTGPRWPVVAEPATAVSRYGANLPNCYQALRNSGNAVWTRVIETARLGLGSDLRDFNMTPSGKGRLELQVVYGTMPDQPIAAELLSEGELAFLGFIALRELNLERSILAFDEPEQHLHPGLLSRVVDMFEEVAATVPVIVATHSDQLLDMLTEPADSVVLCELDQQRSTRLVRPDADALASWLERYKGMGSLRAEGYQGHVFAQPGVPGK